MRTCLGWILVSIALCGCDSDKPRPEPDPPKLSVELGGCQSVTKGPVCALGPKRDLRLWVSSEPDAELQVEVDGKPLQTRPSKLDDGHVFDVDVPEAAQVVRVRARREGVSTTRSIDVTDAEEPEAIRKASALRSEGKLPEAAAVLEPMLSSSDEVLHARAARGLARVERARGNYQRAISLLRDAIELERKTGCISSEVQDRCVLAYTLLYGPRSFSEARSVLEGAKDLEADYAEGRVNTSYYRGLVAYETGDLRDALRLFRESADGARRLGITDQRRDVLQLQADLLSTLGRYDEAQTKMQEAFELLDADAPACRRGMLLNNMAWVAMRAPRSRRTQSQNAAIGKQLERAAGIFEKDCPMPPERAHVSTNRAILAWERGAIDEARKHLDEARASVPSPEPRLAVWWSTLEGYLAGARGDRKAALDHFSALERVGQAASLPEASLEGALGRARVLADEGKTDEARGAFEQADAMLERWSLEVPLGEGRESFFERHERTARARVAFLVDAAERAKKRKDRENLLDQAARAARLTRARALRVLRASDRVEALPRASRRAWEQSLADYRNRRAELAKEAADDWRRPADELEEALQRRQSAQQQLRESLDKTLARIAPARVVRTDASLRGPAPGEVVVTLFPGDRGWLVFTQGTSTHVDRVLVHQPESSPDSLAAALVEPLRNRLKEAKRVRLCPYGAAQDVDLHALRIDGTPLVQRVPVVYGIDVPVASEREPEARKRALVVGDPRGDLAAARKEADSVTAALTGTEWVVRQLTGEQASHAAIRDALAEGGLDLFHYAGHGVFEGRDGWESGLPLAGDAWLTVGDVLALARAPRRVVLSGCETARTAPGAAVAGLGLGQAFVVAGSGQVIAAKRPVDDALAGALASHLASQPARLDDLGAALAAAQAKMAAAHPKRDWAAFRVLVP